MVDQVRIVDQGSTVDKLHCRNAGAGPVASVVGPLRRVVKAALAAKAVLFGSHVSHFCLFFIYALSFSV